MEALAAISLAGNVLQFVHLSILVLEQVKGRRDGSTSRDCAKLKDEVEDLKKLTKRLQDPSLYQNTSQANKGLWTQAKKCQDIADKMLNEIYKLGIADETYQRSFRKASWTLMRYPFFSQNMKRLSEELHLVESQMQLYITTGQKYTSGFPRKLCRIALIRSCREDLRQILENQSQASSSLDSIEKSIMTKIIEGDAQPLRVDYDIIIEQLGQLHNDTMQTFAEQHGNIQAQLEEINGRLKQLSTQKSSSSANEVSGRALWTAVADGNKDLVDNLLDRGVDVNFTNDDARNESCLHLAARRGNFRILKSLLRQSPALNAYSDEGITPLMSATLADKPHNAEALIDAGCDVEAPLKDTRYSVSGRVDIDNHITKGSTALFLAAQHGHLQLARLLISRGAKVNVRTNHLFTPLHAATIGGFPAVAELLIERGAEIEASTDGQFTPLIYAANHGNDDVALVLLENGANIEAKKSLNMTALLEAFWVQRIGTIEFLLNKGANIDEDLPPLIRQASLLHWAIDLNVSGVVRLLLERRPDLHFWCRESEIEDLMAIANRSGNPAIKSLIDAHFV